MPKLVDLDDDELVILLASRFDLNQGGHFYWYTCEFVKVLQIHHPNYLVISDELKTKSTPDFIDDRWYFLRDFSLWGNDVGLKSPRALTSRLKYIFKEFKKDQRITVISFESSFSLIAALLTLQQFYPALRVSINLLDHGFWSRLFNSKVFVFELLVRNFKKVLKSRSQSFKLLHPSISQVKNFGELIGQKVYLVRHISAFSNNYHTPLTMNPNEVTLLILPWSVDLDYIIDFMNSYSTKIGLTFKVHIHFKNENDLSYFFKNLDFGLVKKIDYSVGVLSAEEYIAQFKRVDIAWIPYSDFYHQTTGSGRAFDCLALGCPLIIDEKSDLAQMVADFPLIWPYSTADTSSIIDFLELIGNEKKDSKKYFEKRLILEMKGAEFFNGIKGIDSFLEPFDNNSTIQDRTLGKLDISALDVLYYTGFFYQRVNSTLKKFRKILAH